MIRILAALAILHQDEERDELILFFLSSWCNSSYSSYCPGAIHPILHIILVQFILFFKSSWCNSSYSSCCPGAINPILQFVLVQNSKELNQFCPQAAATTFAFSSVFILLLGGGGGGGHQQEQLSIRAHIKGSVSKDFFHDLNPPRPLTRSRLKYFQILLRFRQDMLIY